MHILIGLGIVVAVLYGWLLGNPLARFLMFLLLIPVGFILVGVFGPGQLDRDPNVALHWLFLGGWLVCCWFIAAIPSWSHRQSLRR